MLITPYLRTFELELIFNLVLTQDVVRIVEKIPFKTNGLFLGNP